MVYLGSFLHNFEPNCFKNPFLLQNGVENQGCISSFQIWQILTTLRNLRGISSSWIENEI